MCLINSTPRRLGIWKPLAPDNIKPPHKLYYIMRRSFRSCILIKISYYFITCIIRRRHVTTISSPSGISGPWNWRMISFCIHSLCNRSMSTTRLTWVVHLVHLVGHLVPSYQVIGGCIFRSLA